MRYHEILALQIHNNSTHIHLPDLLRHPALPQTPRHVHQCILNHSHLRDLPLKYEYHTPKTRWNGYQPYYKPHPSEFSLLHPDHKQPKNSANHPLATSLHPSGTKSHQLPSHPHTDFATHQISLHSSLSK